MTPRSLVLAAVMALVLTCAALPARAAPDSCEAAARIAAAETGVPPAILSAILLAESGRPDDSGTLRPWPWTLHAAGEGYWLSSAEEAGDMLARLVATGLTNIDIGCFQVNLHWHAAAYSTPAALLDPLTNARHAAGFLAGLHRDTGDWRSAAGRYHSRDPLRAETYVRRLEALHAGDTTPPSADPPPKRTAPLQTTGLPLIDFGRRIAPLAGQVP